MNKAFENILERLEEAENILLNNSGDIGCTLGIINMSEYSKQIVQEVAEEYNDGWIPCSERLPEDSQKFYLVTYKQVHFGEFYYFTGITYLSTLSNGQKSWEIEEADFRKKVVAWQPLPEPYNDEKGNL